MKFGNIGVFVGFQGDTQLRKIRTQISFSLVSDHIRGTQVLHKIQKNMQSQVLHKIKKLFYMIKISASSFFVEQTREIDRITLLAVR
jgi:hypothetical protein